MRRVALLTVSLLVACDGPTRVDDAGVLDAGPPDAGRVYVPEPFSPTAATRAYCPLDDDAVEARITELLAALSLREKVAMMSGEAVAIVDHAWRTDGVERLGLPGFAMLDGPRGLSAFSNLRGTAFPVGMARGATWDPALEREVGAAMARELRSVSADVLLAPTINLLRHPRWGRAQETYGEDTHHVGEMGVAFIEGVQSEGVLASAKHFAANSIEDTRHTVNVEIDERTLREVYLPHFRRAVQEAQVASIMSAYNQVNGLYCDLNAHLLNDILKGEWEFAGFVESDWILGTHGDVESVRAGLDIEMPNDANFRRLRAAVLNGAMAESEIDASVRRILRAQLCYALDPAVRGVDDPSARETDAHLALARRAATESVVLLENDGVLPLAADATLFVAGRAADVENIGDEGSSRVRPSDVVTVVEGLEARGVAFTHLAGTTLDAAQEAAARAADVVVVVTGLLAEDEGEAEIGGGDRESLEVPADEVALIRALAALNPNVVVVLEGGAAFTVSDWSGDARALMMAFYPGQQGGHALADLLFGDASPSGRLPFSMPAREADLPPFDNTSETVRYEYLHGYRHLASEGTAAAYPFGFGIGYTTFTHDNLTLSSETIDADGTLELTVDVINAGATRGRDVVQLYVAAEGSRVSRAPWDLRAFASVELEPGARETVTLRVPVRDLAFWDEATGAWEVERVAYTARVAHHAEDPGLSAAFSVE
ncbi:MAG: hypothetical protein SangKO_043890 [Sandaracinaceae bacterium]